MSEPLANPPQPAPAPAFAATLVAALADAGVRDACVSPGSRSTPLVLALHRHPGIRIHLHLDERSSGFFALGLARASRLPVAVVCTSGTAAANLLPAAVEANLSRVPLLLLTADRPPELRDLGAPQTIDQTALFGSHTRWYAEAPVPDGTDLAPYARTLGARAVALATGAPAGPVHLNLPFREPLAPDRPAELPPVEARAAGRRPRVWPAPVAPSAEAVAHLCALVERHPRGVIACGPIDDPTIAASVARLARAAKWPVLAEPTSQTRRGGHVAPGFLSHGDLLLGCDEFAAAHAPEVVVRIGALPTSKAFGRWLARHAPEQCVVIDDAAAFRDPAHAAADFVRGAPGATCDAVAAALRTPERGASAWLDAFVAADARAADAVTKTLAQSPALLAAETVRCLGERLPADALLYVANSMAVRDLDAYLPADPGPVRVLANRGANGIDGLVSSALGAAHAGQPTVLLTGDLAFLHDASGILSAGGERVPLTIVILNDDGGGIFSHLPVAALGEAAGFDRLFRTPHGRDLARVCAGAGLPHTRAESRGELEAALADALAAAAPRVIEVAVDAAANLAQHRAVRAAVARALSAS